MKGLTDGTYTLVEASAPEGYMVAEKIEFTIENGELVEGENAKNGTVTMTDEQKKTDVKISKVDAGQGNELAGATLTLMKEGQEEAVTSWLSNGTVHTVEGLTDGVYTLVEESAPDGYKKRQAGRERERQGRHRHHEGRAVQGRRFHQQAGTRTGQRTRRRSSHSRTDR